MRLKPAIALQDYEEDAVSGYHDFGDRESRLARREARRERREQRREARQEKKADRRLERVQRKRQKVRQKLVPATRAPVAQLQPAPTAFAPSPAPSPTRRPLVDRAVEWVDEALEDEPLDEEVEDDATEGFGVWTQWGPVVQVGQRLRIQAAVGHRAAVIELKPGLYLIADIPEAVTRTQFGLAPLLAPMMMRAARRSLDEPGEERRGPFARLFRRRQREEPVRYVQVVQPDAGVPPVVQQVPQLPGPTEDGTMLVPAPNVGWADDATVAAVYGCDTCERSRR